MTANTIDLTTTPRSTRRTPAAPEVMNYRADLRDALEAYRTEHGLTNGALARELGTSATRVSKYLNRAPEGNVAELESWIEDVLKTAPQRRLAKDEYFHSSVTKAVRAACETIRRTNDVGLIHGAAGVGKSCGAALYTAEHAATVHVVLSRWTAGTEGLEAALMAAVDGRGKRHSERRAEWLVQRFAGSHRLIIIDNAHRLTVGARQWIFDFHDATGVPVALIGNPEVLTAIRGNDQQFSRIGLQREVRPRDHATCARHLLDQLAPEHAEVLLPLATLVAERRGHLRTLKKHMLLLPEFLPLGGGDPAQAFLLASTQLVTDYRLGDLTTHHE